MPGFPVHHQLPELAQTHVHQVSDAIQPSDPLLSPSPPAFNLSQHQGPFQRVNLEGNQSWVFIGRTDAEAEVPILWPSDEKSQLIRKDPDAGKD